MNESFSLFLRRDFPFCLRALVSSLPQNPVFTSNDAVCALANDLDGGVQVQPSPTVWWRHQSPQWKNLLVDPFASLAQF